MTDDMEIAPDFFKYFEATSHLLDNDRCAAYGLFLYIYYYSSMVQWTVSKVHSGPESWKNKQEFFFLMDSLVRGSVLSHSVY